MNFCASTDLAIHNRLAKIAIGANTLRRQGGTGIPKYARKYLSRHCLVGFGNITSADEYSRFLDRRTQGLLKYWRKHCTPSPGYTANQIASWVAARKIINIFMMSIWLSRFSPAGRQIRASWLEVPLDKEVADKLRQLFRQRPYNQAFREAHPTSELTPWYGMTDCSSEQYFEYQTFASWLAKHHDRVGFLELYLWT